MFGDVSEFGIVCVQLFHQWWKSRQISMSLTVRSGFCICHVQSKMRRVCLYWPVHEVLVWSWASFCSSFLSSTTMGAGLEGELFGLPRKTMPVCHLFHFDAARHNDTASTLAMTSRVSLCFHFISNHPSSVWFCFFKIPHYLLFASFGCLSARLSA